MKATKKLKNLIQRNKKKKLNRSNNPEDFANLAEFEDAWNHTWEVYIEQHPDATKEQVLAQLDQMADDFGISQYRAVKKSDHNTTT